MDRRVFISGITLGLLAAPHAAEAQPTGKVYRIGVLLPLGVTPPILARFLGGMRDLGWVIRASLRSLATLRGGSNASLNSPRR